MYDSVYVGVVGKVTIRTSVWFSQVILHVSQLSLQPGLDGA